MTKTWEEYYNDPEIINEPSAMREIHAIRLMLADERKGMTAAEHTALVKREGESFLAECRKHRGLHE